MLIKYMGNADVRKIERGEDFGGRLATPVHRDIVWDWGNNHVVDSSDPQYLDVPEEVWVLLSVEPNFQDVTDDKIVPLNDAQRYWRGMRDASSPVFKDVPPAVPENLVPIRMPEDSESTGAIESTPPVQDISSSVSTGAVESTPPVHDQPIPPAEVVQALVMHTPLEGLLLPQQQEQPQALITHAPPYSVEGTASVSVARFGG